MIRRTMPMQVQVLGDREVEIRMMTGGLKADGYDLVPEGCLLDNYRLNPIQLWQHNPEHPVGRNDNVRIDGGGIAARCTFAPAGASAKADEVCALTKANIINACSVGFEVREKEPINPRDPRAGFRATSWELFECSFVSVPLDPQAGVTAREQGGQRMAEDWKCGAARDLPIQDGDPAWDGPAAEQAIFEWAGGDDFDPARARRAFLAYDANAPKLRGSYKLPFASVVDGDLKVPKAGIRAAASRLPQADLPQEVKDSADAVLEGYKKKAKMGDYAEEGDGRSRQRRRRPARARGPVLKARGMYGIAHLAYCINEVAESKEMAELESAMEGDESKVPMLLHNAIQALGVALQAMTEEEIAELLENDDVDVAEDDDGLDDGEVRQIAKAGTELAKRFLRAKYRGRHAMMAARAGKALSSANADLIGQAEGHHTKALEHHRVASEAHGNVGDAHQGLVDAHAKMRSAHDAMGAELEKDVPDQQVLRGHHRTIGRHLDGADGHMMTATDEHEAVGDSQRACARSVRAASRCLRAVDGYDGEEGGEGAMPGAQNSGGVTEGTSRNSADPDFRRRQAVKLKLAAG